MAFSTSLGGFRPAVPAPRAGMARRPARDTRGVALAAVLSEAEAAQADVDPALLRAQFREARAFQENAALRAEAARLGAQLKKFRCAGGRVRLLAALAGACAELLSASPTGCTYRRRPRPRARRRARRALKRPSGWRRRNKTPRGVRAALSRPGGALRAVEPAAARARVSSAAWWSSRSRGLRRTQSRCAFPPAAPSSSRTRRRGPPPAAARRLPATAPRPA